MALSTFGMEGGKGLLAGILLGGIIELIWHLFWHFTVPGASIAMEIAEFTGLTDAFAQSASAGAEVIASSASETIASEAATHVADDFCELPFCPIHNPDLSAFGEAAAGVVTEPPLSNISPALPAQDLPTMAPLR